MTDNKMKPYTISQCCTAEWCRGYNEAVKKANEIIEALISAQETLQKHIENAKTEAINEFAERLKEKRIKPEYPWDDFFVTEGIIDEVLKEMVGEDQ